MNHCLIFLDIDGVLTSEAHTRKCVLNNERENILGLDWFDPECVRNLKRITDATNAVIVLSSDHRTADAERTARIIKAVDPQVKWLFIPPTTKETKVQYIQRIPKPERYVILDDDNLGLPNQVKTDTRTGLTEDDAQKAIETLQKKMKPKKKHLTHEQAYIKAICKAQREEIGFSPTLVQRNRKKYNRSAEKRETKKITEF